MKPPQDCPSLLALAEACYNGACNVSGLVRSLPAALDELDGPWTAAQHPAVQTIIGHLAWLCGQAPGPTSQAYQDYSDWKLSEGCYSPDESSRIRAEEDADARSIESHCSPIA